jgi:hypothetical protein
MPCFDGREKQDGRNQEIRVSALTAMLCGAVKGEHRVMEYVGEWCGVHMAIDELREQRPAGPGTSVQEANRHHDQIRGLQSRADDILSRAYRALCDFDPKRDSGQIQDL